MDHISNEVSGAKIIFYRPSEQRVKQFNGRVKGVVLTLFPKEKVVIYPEHVSILASSKTLNVQKTDVRSIYDQKGVIVFTNEKAVLGR